MKKADWVRWGGIGVIVILAGIFSWLNSGESVALHFGLFVVYQLPVVTIFYVAFLLGMTTMFLLGLRHDMAVRRVLRERGIVEAEQPPVPPDLPV
jgi:uncharacterized integral membrane protein